MVNRRAESLLGRKRLPSAPSIETDKPPAPPAWDVWSPNMGTAFKLLMSARLCAALWSIVSDCDETFNYWEPAHFLYTGKGLQTWEYSPEFALRSYSYILLHVLPMRVLATVLGESSILVFYMTRCLLGLACALSELLFYRGICAMFGGAVGRLTLVVMLFAAGMFTAAAAFLPSSFSMYLTMVAYGAWMLRKDNLSILAIAASTIIGWPFAVALGVPIAVDILFLRRKMAFFIKWCAVGLVVFLVPMIAIDQHFYGRLVIAPLNIVLYNVFSSHGPDLYGTEPLSYYLINGFLNYNFAFVMALCSLPFFAIIFDDCTHFITKKNINDISSFSNVYLVSDLLHNASQRREILIPHLSLHCIGCSFGSGWHAEAPMCHDPPKDRGQSSLLRASPMDHCLILTGVCCAVSVTHCGRTSRVPCPYRSVCRAAPRGIQPQGSHSAPRQACQCVCGEGVVQIP